ncbi:holo-ACP synthase [Candidatus Hydrogenedentota bacterium]
MIIGLGTDLVSIPRFARITERWGKRFFDRVFTESEVEFCMKKTVPTASLAARFAAKEAALKALGAGWSGGISWHDAEVVSTPKQAPRLRLSGVAKRLAAEAGVESIHLSLTHTDKYASATVILEGQRNEQS